MNNLITRTDSYKFSHSECYAPGTKTLYQYVTPRGGEFPYTLFFGLQMFLPKLSQPFTSQDIDEAEDDVNLHFGRKIFNRAGWEHILNQHGGHLPLRIDAVPEGLLLPIKDKNGRHIPVVTVQNTDDACFWLPGHIETQLVRAIWYATTVCTNSFACKVAILQARNQSCDEPLAGLDYALHDFGARGVSSAESAEIGGAAHLVNFKGSDTFECLRPIRHIYHEQMAANSVVAAEHSTIISWRRGRYTHEVDAYDNMLAKFAKERGGVIAVVSDSYDLWFAIRHIWGGQMRQRVVDSGCTIVVRPDSGDPLTVPVKAVEMLAEFFGFSVNRKGYKVLPPCIRVIQGDGITRHTISLILSNLLAAGFSAENLIFGMGGALLQTVNRDTMEWAMKVSATEDQTGWWDVWKSPVDQPMKQSLAGRFGLINESGEFTDYETVPLRDDISNLLATVWENGETLVNDKFSTIRQRAHEAALVKAGDLTHG